jgi:hypothetical protein
VLYVWTVLGRDERILNRIERFFGSGARCSFQQLLQGRAQQSTHARARDYVVGCLLLRLRKWMAHLNSRGRAKGTSLKVPSPSVSGSIPESTGLLWSAQLGSFNGIPCDSPELVDGRRTHHWNVRCNVFPTVCSTSNLVEVGCGSLCSSGGMLSSKTPSGIEWEPRAHRWKERCNLFPTVRSTLGFSKGWRSYPGLSAELLPNHEPV